MKCTNVFAEVRSKKGSESHLPFPIRLKINSNYFLPLANLSIPLNPVLLPTAMALHCFLLHNKVGRNIGKVGRGRSYHLYVYMQSFLPSNFFPVVFFFTTNHQIHQQLKNLEKKANRFVTNCNIFHYISSDIPHTLTNPTKSF